MLDTDLNSFLVGNKLKLLKMQSYKGGYLWEVEKIPEDIACLRCGSINTIKAGRCTTTVREESVRSQLLWLKIYKHRIYCKDCKKTFAEPVLGIWPRRRSTQRFRKYIATACGKSSDLSTVSKFYKVSHGFAYQVYYEQIKVKLNEFRDQVKWPTTLGIDEHFFRRVKGKGTEFVTMLTDLNKKRVFEIAQGKESSSLIEQLKDIPGRENVKVVVMDMSGSYRSFVKKFFPNAKIVADKFHVLRLLSPSIMKAGKEIHGHRQELSTRRKLLRNRMKLDYFVRVEIDEYLKNHPKLKELYQWKERMFSFYRIKGFKRAKKAMNGLIEKMKNSNLIEIQKLSRTFQNWKNEILKYFENKYTNGFTERMNGTGKLVQRRAFGYKSFKNYRLRVLSACLFKIF